jgi:endonuclease YncB( thermonuclease family)
VFRLLLRLPVALLVCLTTGLPLGRPAAAASTAAAAPAAVTTTLPCQLADERRATVVAVPDGRTLKLADGSLVRLIGIADLAFLGPGRPAAPAPAAAEAKAALAALALNQTVRLQSPAQPLDRYGRRLALAFPAESAGSASLQQTLIASGHAVVAARITVPECAAPFLAAEQAARAARLGLWADPYYDIATAERPTALAGNRGRFAIVEGRVLSVRDRGATIYVNFGRRWSSDFTVTISKRNERRFVAAGLAPKTLAGHRVRIRGWLDERGGPWIEAADPAQIEWADRH